MRERQNVDDATSLLVELGHLTARDEWQQNRILEIRSEGERAVLNTVRPPAAAVARCRAAPKRVRP